MKDFKEYLIEYSLPTARTGLSTLQLNLGKRCNQACVHCHVDAGPDRPEQMSRQVVERILSLLENETQIHTVDLTGGAPEMNPSFRFLVRELSRMGRRIIDRCNLTVLLEPGQETTAEFLAEHHVHVISSLPCYLDENVDAQRGDQVYQKSIQALKKLNRLGYGKELLLDLVYNPGGPFLPPDQKELEADYREQLSAVHDIQFSNLLTITNMPINRFKEQLELQELDLYMKLLREEFNQDAAARIMCGDLLSIGWDGSIHSCDFNQALGLKLAQSIWTIDRFQDVDTHIVFGDHCFGCTAGSGSSCKGALI